MQFQPIQNEICILLPIFRKAIGGTASGIASSSVSVGAFPAGAELIIAFRVRMASSPVHLSKRASFAMIDSSSAMPRRLATEARIRTTFSKRFTIRGLPFTWFECARRSANLSIVSSVRRSSWSTGMPNLAAAWSTSKGASSDQLRRSFSMRNVLRSSTLAGSTSDLAAANAEKDRP